MVHLSLNTVPTIDALGAGIRLFLFHLRMAIPPRNPPRFSPDSYPIPRVGTFMDAQWAWRWQRTAPSLFQMTAEGSSGECRLERSAVVVSAARSPRGNARISRVKISRRGGALLST